MSDSEYSYDSDNESEKIVEYSYDDNNEYENFVIEEIVDCDIEYPVNIKRLNNNILIKFNAKEFFNDSTENLINNKIIYDDICILHNNEKILKIYFENINNNGILETFYRHLIEIKSNNLTKSLLKECQHIYKNLRKHCIICLKDLSDLDLIYPTVCTNEFCKFSNLLKIDIDFEFKHNTDVCKLLINLFQKTIQNSKGSDEDFLCHYSTDFKHNIIQYMKNNGDKDKDFNNEKEVRNEYLKLIFSDINKVFDNYKINPYNMILKWLICSNPTTIIKRKIFDEIKYDQYVIVNDYIEKETKFQKLKKIHGSFYAFHGSPINKWHSIIRSGLKNLSNTDKMTTGAIYGPGIYTSLNSSVSIGYTTYNDNFISLCEIIDLRKDETKIKNVSNIYIIKDENIIITRYLFHGTGINFTNNCDCDARKLLLS